MSISFGKESRGRETEELGKEERKVYACEIIIKCNELICLDLIVFLRTTINLKCIKAHLKSKPQH
ncbi:hypothetical protein BpHYR1_035151 [Brachionus plicatilis]|uniref:Uncharacterized protein n=1 Tax=Brachionus plicatilis TaxID=10195 RepID=A0A3M7SE97_BRAPC|nr:hypothetical protein BpHYR1_035151 [Brachionus plicatilis]